MTIGEKINEFNYLGVTLDSKLTFIVNFVCDKKYTKKKKFGRLRNKLNKTLHCSLFTILYLDNEKN